MSGQSSSALLPSLRWLREYQPGWLKQDLLAGITLAAYLLPAGIGDASLAGLPPEAGLYACLFSGLVFWLFCSSRHTAITVTSAISLLVGASLGSLAQGDVGRYSALAACTALIVALLAFVAWLFKAGAIVHFISDPVMIGFKSGLALFLASTQLPKLCGFKGSHGDFWERSGHFLSHLGETNFASLTIGLLALAVLVAGKVWLKDKPVALFVVAGGIVLSPLLGLEARGVKLLGTVPQGLPMPGLPAVQWADLNELLPLAMACFLIGAVETAAIGRMFCAKHGGRFDGNQELLALAASNFAAGLGRSFPVSGGMSQSLVNESAGARTPLSGLVASVIVLLITVFLSGLLRHLPQPVLAAVVLFAIAGLFKLKALIRLWTCYRAEFVVAIAAMAGVLGSGLLRGVLIGAIISLLQLLRRSSHPYVAFLGRVPGTRRYSDLAKNPENEAVGDLLLVRPESALYYFNIDHVRDTIVDKARALVPTPSVVVLDLSAAPHVDLQAAQTLIALHGDMVAMGSQLRVVEARASVRETLRLEGFEERVGPINPLTAVADAVDGYFSSQSAAGDPPTPAAGASSPPGGGSLHPP